MSDSVRFLLGGLTCGIRLMLFLAIIGTIWLAIWTYKNWPNH